jgi:predicted RNA binding protein YcfA (HicA-like mRNA interferase family)
MRLPRDTDAASLIKSLRRLGYAVSRQAGSHIRLTTLTPQQHHITIPNHSPIKIGTLNAILSDIANHHQLSRDELLKRLFD